jgi:hypothetical protein
VDKGLLVEASVKLLRFLKQEGVDVRAALLTYTLDRGWRLLIAPSKFEGTRSLYQRIAEVFHKYGGRIGDLHISDVDVIEPDSETIRSLGVSIGDTGEQILTYPNVRLGRKFYEEIIPLPVSGP